MPAWARAELEPARVALDWKTPETGGCATQKQIKSEVARLTDRELVSHGHSFRIEALALLHEGSWVASVALHDESGRLLGGREVVGAYVHCTELDVPVALVVATLLDGLRAPPEPTRKLGERTPGPRDDKLGIGAFLAAAVGLLPKPSVGAGVAVDLPLGWPVALDASAYLPRDKVDSEGRGARAWGFHAGASLCPRLFGRKHELRLCGGAQVGAVVARAVRLTESRRDTKPLVLVGIEPKLLLELAKGWALQVSIAAYWVAVHPRFHWEIEGSGERSLNADTFAAQARIGVIKFRD